jgi:hypothetical protein
LLSLIGLVATRESSPADGLWWLCSRGKGGGGVGRSHQFVGCFSGFGSLFDLQPNHLFAESHVSLRFQIVERTNEFRYMAGEMFGLTDLCTH